MDRVDNLRSAHEKIENLGAEHPEENHTSEMCQIATSALSVDDSIERKYEILSDIRSSMCRLVDQAADKGRIDDIWLDRARYLILQYKRYETGSLDWIALRSANPCDSNYWDVQEAL